MNTNVTPANIAHLASLWGVLFPGIDEPTRPQWVIWLSTFSPAMIERALPKLAIRYEKNPIDFPAATNLHRFMTSMLLTAARHSKERKAA